LAKIEGPFKQGRSQGSLQAFSPPATGSSQDVHTCGGHSSDLPRMWKLWPPPFRRDNDCPRRLRNKRRKPATAETRLLTGSLEHGGRDCGRTTRIWSDEEREKHRTRKSQLFGVFTFQIRTFETVQVDGTTGQCIARRTTMYSVHARADRTAAAQFSYSAASPGKREFSSWHLWISSCWVGSSLIISHDQHVMILYYWRRWRSFQKLNTS